MANVDNTSDTSKPVSTAQQTAIDAAYTNANKYTDKKIADLIGSAPETMDTLEEVAAAIQENKDVETALNEAIGKKANQTELDTHTGNSTIHITASERTNWNAAKTHADSAHARADATKVEKSTTNGSIKINGTETTVYTHPSGTNPHGTTKSDVGLGNVGNYKAVSTVASQGLSDTEKVNARANIGAQIAGSYASSSHNHDTVYSKLGHTHDDRYCTESEMDTKLADKVDLSADGVSKAINQLTIGTDAPSDADYYVSQYATGGTTHTSYHRRPMSALWSYIKSKADSVYSALGHKHTKSEITDFPASMPANGGDADHATRLVCTEKRPTSANKASSSDRAGMMEMFLASSSMTTGKPSADAKILQMNWDNTSGWDSQLAMINSGTLQHRNMSNGKWQNWKTVLDSSNYSKQMSLEEGFSWTPIFNRGDTNIGTDVAVGYYYKIGKLVYLRGYVQLQESSPCYSIKGLPLAISSSVSIPLNNLLSVSISKYDSNMLNVGQAGLTEIRNVGYNSSDKATKWIIEGWYLTD